MKKKYITLEEVLSLRGTDIIFYKETIPDRYFKFKDGIVCRFTKDGKMDDIGVYVSDIDDPYILEPEEFKVEKTGKYRTRDGRVAYVTRIIEKHRYGIITGSSNVDTWKDSGIYCSSGVFISNGDSPNDLVEYLGD